MPHIQTNAGELYYAGPKPPLQVDSPPLLLVHAAGGTRLDWPPGLRRLPDATVLALDLPGHGKSPGPGRDSIDAYAEVVIALLDALQLQRVIVAGHSMGGAIAQTLALAHPERVAGLVLIGTGAKLGVHPDILERVIPAQAEVGRLLHDWMWGDSTPAELRDRGYELFMTIPPEVIHGDYAACNAFDIRHRLGEINAPALIIGGTADRMTPHKFSAYLAEHIRDSRLVTVEGGGHLMMLEQPDAVAGAIRDWLAALPG